MTRNLINALALIGAVVTLGAGLGAAQRGWTVPGKSSATTPSRTLVARPQAQIIGSANGLYCTPNIENGVEIHDIGGVPAGLHVTVTVESFSDGFDPVAAVIGALVGQKGGNTVKTATFYDNDSGGDKDAKIDFVAPHTGNYFLMVGDYADVTTGCYRYEVTLR
jgi:hypothetical protein